MHCPVIAAVVDLGWGLSCEGGVGRGIGTGWGTAVVGVRSRSYRLLLAIAVVAVLIVEGGRRLKSPTACSCVTPLPSLSPARSNTIGLNSFSIKRHNTKRSSLWSCSTSSRSRCNPRMVVRRSLLVAWVWASCSWSPSRRLSSSRWRFRIVSSKNRFVRFYGERNRY